MTRTRELPPWRSILSVPINVDTYVEKAHTRGADVIQLELENSVPLDEKARARGLIGSAAAKVRRGGADVVVRINRPLSLAVLDLAHAICPDVDGIVCSRVDSAGHVELLDELVTELEGERGIPIGRTRFIIMIETPRGFARIDEISHASDRIVAMNLGGEVFALHCAIEPDPEVLQHAKQRMIFAARAAGIIPVGYLATAAEFGDLTKFREMVRRSRRFGFDCASCIHPGQVTVVNEEYTPSPAEIAHATKIVTMAKEAERDGRGSFSLDGKMINIPIVQRAENLLRRAAAIQARQRARTPAV